MLRILIAKQRMIDSWFVWGLLGVGHISYALHMTFDGVPHLGPGRCQATSGVFILVICDQNHGLVKAWEHH